MRYEIQINGSGYVDHTVKEDGTIVTSNGSKPSVTTYIRALCPIDARGVNRNQAFAIFVLIMQLHKEFNKPIVTGDVSWDDIVAGAK